MTADPVLDLIVKAYAQDPYLRTFFATVVEAATQRDVGILTAFATEASKLDSVLASPARKTSAPVSLDISSASSLTLADGSEGKAILKKNNRGRPSTGSAPQFEFRR